MLPGSGVGWGGRAEAGPDSFREWIFPPLPHTGKPVFSRPFNGDGGI